MTEPRQHNKETKLLYSVFALLKCINQYIDYITTSNHTMIRELRQELSKLKNQSRYIFHVIEANITAEDKEIWKADWQRDYMSAASIFECWAVMDEESRDKVDAFADNLTKENTFVKSIPFKKIEDCAPKIASHYLIVCKGNDIVLHTTFHNEKLGFYSVAQSAYIPYSQVQLIYVL